MKSNIELPPRISLRPLSQLTGWERNYRRGDVSAIKRSIRKFGFNGALRVWCGGVVMAGNHALLALKQMQEESEHIPKGVLADPSGGWLIACIDISHLSEQEAEAFAIADNRTQELGTIDPRLLNELVEELGAQDPDLIEGAGFDSEQLQQMLGNVATPRFEPVSAEEQGDLDQPRRVDCPECGHRFPI